MAIINNRRKICSEVPSDKYKDNFDAIFGKKETHTNGDEITSKNYDRPGESQGKEEDKDGNT